MSSRVRYLAQIDGYCYTGADARQRLSRAGFAVVTRADMERAARLSGARLWIFREPRNLPVTKSRYKRLCQALGIGRSKKQKKVPHAGPRIRFANNPVAHGLAPDLGI